MKNYVLHGKVTHGRQLGSSFNIPTANIIPKEDISGLTFGVYYSTVTVSGRSYKSITNLGIKPTVKDSKEVNVESFIYDFDGDLYDKEIIVTLLEFRRPEMKFESVDKLFETINTDLKEGREFDKQG